MLEGVAANPGVGTVSNRFPWQARMAVERLLDYAKDHKLDVRVLSGKCPEGFYNEKIANKLTECSHEGCKIKVLVWQKDTTGIAPTLLKLSEAGAIDLRISATDNFANAVPHFLIAGEKAFRQEAAHPPFTDKTSFSETEPQVPARIDFDDPATGKVLVDFFDKVWGK